MKVAVFGSGISGLSVANILKEKKFNVTIFEKSEMIGGLIKCERVKDCLFHKVGGHVFNSKNQKVLDWFWSFFDREKDFIKSNRNAKVYFNKNIIGYPFENYIHKLPQNLVQSIVSELVNLNKNPAKRPNEYQNFKEFLTCNFGKTLFDIYFKPYNEKIWKVDLETVPMEWLEGKLPMPNLEEILYNNIIKAEESSMVHSTFYYPRENGSQFIINTLSKNLKIEKCINNFDFKYENGGCYYNDTKYDKIIYTGDIRNIPKEWKDILITNGVDWMHVNNLRSNGTSNLFCETDDNDISWLYIPENFTKSHRIIYTGNFSETNNRGLNRKTCVVEFSGKVDYHVMIEEIKQLPGNLTAITSNYEPNSYVIQDEKTKKLIVEIKEIFARYNIYLLGRFAEWEYYNMDKAIEAAFDLVEKNF
jgi:protoporphyrinogen oxidase